MSKTAIVSFFKNKFIDKLNSWFDLSDGEDSSLHSLMLKGLSGSFLLKISDTSSRILISVILARLLGVLNYGNYVYVISWIAILGLPVGLGLDKIMVRYIATYNRKGNWEYIKGIFNYSIYSIIISSTLFILLVSIIVNYFLAHGRNTGLYVSFLIALILLPLKTFLNRQCSGLVGFRWIILGQVPILFLHPLLFIFLILIVFFIMGSPASINIVILLNIIATFCSIFVASYWLSEAVPYKVKISKPKYELNEWLLASIPLMLMSGMYMINANADILMLGLLSGTKLSGIYHVVDRGASLILFLLGALIATFSPIIAHLYAGGEIEKLQRIITKYTRITFLLTFPIGLCLIFFGKWILGIFGKDFQQGYMALVILSISQMINVISGPVANILVMTGHERDAAFGIGISVIVNIILNALFIPIWGLVGAAVATGSSTVVWNLLLIWFVQNRINLNPTAFKLRL